MRHLARLHLHPAQRPVRGGYERQVSAADLGQRAQAIDLDLGFLDLVVAQREEFLDLGQVLDARLGELALGARRVHRLVVQVAAQRRLVVGRVGDVELLLQLGEIAHVGARELPVGHRFLHLVAVSLLLLVAAEPVLDAHRRFSFNA